MNKLLKGILVQIKWTILFSLKDMSPTVIPRKGITRLEMIKSDINFIWN